MSKIETFDWFTVWYKSAFRKSIDRPSIVPTFRKAYEKDTKGNYFNSFKSLSYFFYEFFVRKKKKRFFREILEIIIRQFDVKHNLEISGTDWSSLLWKFTNVLVKETESKSKIVPQRVKLRAATTQTAFWTAVFADLLGFWFGS